MAKINFRALMETEGVKLEELPDKIKRKIAEYDKTINHPFSYKKGTDEFNPKSKEKLDDLNDDICVAIEEVVEDRTTTTPELTAAELEAQRLAEEEKAKEAAAEKEAQHLAEEEKAKKDAEAKKVAEEKAARLEAKRAAVQKKNKHFTSFLYGEEPEPTESDVD